MEFPLLAKHNIFALHAVNLTRPDNKHLYLLYAPLNAVCKTVDVSVVHRLEEELLNNSNPLNYSVLLQELLNNIPFRERFNNTDSVSRINKMAILPTHSCNLSCSYCYSSHGRNSYGLTREALTAGLEFFINPGRIKNPYLHITIIGAGEPLLEWDMVEYAIDYAFELASRGGFNLNMTLVTNGTIVNGQIIYKLKKYHIVPNISFEILERFQNLQRGKYFEVAANLRKLSDAGLILSVNATITPENVSFQDQMVEEIIHSFPGVKHLVFEPVISNNVFSGISGFKSFYSLFTRYFFNARKLGLQNNVMVSCKTFNNMNRVSERGCDLRFSLSPGGYITDCYCVSSPLEPNFNNRCYGKIDDNNQVYIDKAGFMKVLQNNVYNKPYCENCFVKWNCAGACSLLHEVYGEDYREAYCDFTRDFSKQVLFERVKDQIA